MSLNTLIWTNKREDEQQSKVSKKEQQAKTNTKASQRELVCARFAQKLVQKHTSGIGWRRQRVWREIVLAALAEELHVVRLAIDVIASHRIVGVPARTSTRLLSDFGDLSLTFYVSYISVLVHSTAGLSYLFV